jgi:hypothetical protein
MVGERPDFLAGLGVQSIKVRIATTEVHRAIHYRSGRLNSNLVVKVRIIASFEAPFFPTRGGVQSVEVGVPAAHKKHTVGNCWGSVHYVASLELPIRGARRSIQRVDVAIATPEQNRAVPYHRRR